MTSKPARIAAAVLLVVAFAVVVLVTSSKDSGGGGGGDAVRVVGLVGSEKAELFADPRVKQRLKELGYDVTIDTAGSRSIAERTQAEKYDFYFPAGVQYGRQAQAAVGAKRTYEPFSTPLVFATFAQIAGVLRQAGIADEQGGLDVKKYLALVEKGVRWRDVKGNDAYRSGRQVLATTTDVRTSNSAAQYLSLLAYVAGGEQVPSGDAATKLAAGLAPFFTEQGFTEQSSEGPFEDYLSIGAGKVPLVAVYESQFLGRLLREDGTVQPAMQLLYPDPGIVVKHVVVPITDAGSKIGALLVSDPQLQQLAARNGYRTRRIAELRSRVERLRNGAVPDLVNLAETPDPKVLAAMIDAVARAYDAR